MTWAVSDGIVLFFPEYYSEWLRVLCELLTRMSCHGTDPRLSSDGKHHMGVVSVFISMPLSHLASHTTHIDTSLLSG